MESDKKVGYNAVFQRDPEARITHLLINACVSVTLLHPKFRLHGSTWSIFGQVRDYPVISFDRF
jgi:hypothetical protein